MLTGGRSTAAGDLCIVGGVLSASLYSVLAKRFADDSDALSLTTWQFTAATAVATRSGTIGACLIGGSVIYFTICHGRAIEPDLSPAVGPETLIHDAHAPETEKPHAAAGQSAR